MNRRLRRILSSAIIAIGTAAIGLPMLATTAAAEDTTPPVGTLVIDGGRGYTADGVLDLDVAATDDVGVTTVRIGLLGGGLTDLPYAPHIVYSIGDVSTMAQQQLTLYVEWLDAAGNHSSAQKMFWLDWAAPVLRTFATTTDQGPAGTVTFSIGAYEEASGIAAVRFSTNGGSSWGSEIPMSGPVVVWDPRDATLGGKPKGLGDVTVSAKVRDGSGQWSNVRSTTITMANELSIGVSSNPTTGKPITLSADWAYPVTLPKGAMCLWEFMWGDDRSIYEGNRDQTFGYLATQGLASKGFCDTWSFTLPWTAVRHYLVSLRVMQSDWTTLGEHMIGSSPSDPSFASSVGSTSRQITSSNLPMFYVLPDSYELQVGQPAVYHAYALGGATIRSSDSWVIEYVNTPETHPGSSTLTFYPKRTGYITVCLGRDYSAGTQMSACYDPPVKAGSGSGGSAGGSGAATSPPSHAPPSEGSPSPTSPPSSGTEPTSEPVESALPQASAVPSASTGDVAMVSASGSPAAPGAGSSPGVDQPANVPPPDWIPIGIVGSMLVLGFVAARPGGRAWVARTFSSIHTRSRGR